MRSKEEAHDYRYFPEPDLPPLELDPAWIEEQRAALPELPDARRQRFVAEYGLPAYDAGWLTQTRRARGLLRGDGARLRQSEAVQQLDHGRAGAPDQRSRSRPSKRSRSRPRGWAS